MLDRQLGIVYLLMNKKTVTAAELAEHYEVSARTIYRDVETLSMAGIPIYASKGRNGGISLTDRFVLNKLLVTKKEQQQILSALTSLDELGALKGAETINKLRALFQVESQNWVSIDFSDWSGTRQQVFEEIKQAIWDHKVIFFDYYGRNGKTGNRTVEPLQVVFKDYTWYLKAFCRTRQAIRIFKLQRMNNVTVTNDNFDWDTEKNKQDEEQINNYVHGTEAHQSMEDNLVKIVLKIKASEAYRVYDLFYEDNMIVLPDGSFQVEIHCNVDDWIYGIILSFGPAAEVVEPAFVRDEMIKRIHEMEKEYKII
ncbi:MAG TPA: YafY family protein [Lachnospiraceae bacterium]|nr:YafY family protein [Lachnospiraceae bacterium]